MVKDCKPVYFVGFLRLMFFQWILNLVVNDEWIVQPLKLCLVGVFAGGPFLGCLCSLIFKLRKAVNVRKKTTGMVFDVPLFF